MVELAPVKVPAVAAGAEAKPAEAVIPETLPQFELQTATGKGAIWASGKAGP